MKNLLRSNALSNLKTIDSRNSCDTNFFNLPMSDFDIIKLQNVLLTFSTSFIKTKDIDSGRTLMRVFLSNLRYYKNIVCFTVVKNEELPDFIFDFFKIKSKSFGIFDFAEMFYIENPSIDFFFIELTEELQKKFSQNEIKKICELFSSENQIPIIVIKYTDGK